MTNGTLKSWLKKVHSTLGCGKLDQFHVKYMVWIICPETQIAFCKRALGPMYRHLKGRYGTHIADYTPTLSFDFSGPLPLAVIGAKILMVFVWRLHEVRLLCAVALVHRTKENVLACLQSLIADLNTLTGWSKPLVARVHSDQAKEFLSRPAMEWLKEKGIRQTFTSTYDSQANGVAERWLNLVKTKTTTLLASRHLPTAFWCYAVAWVARCYNLKALGKNLPEFGQLLMVRINRDNNLQERGILGIMAGTYLEIANGWRHCPLYQGQYYSGIVHSPSSTTSDTGSENASKVPTQCYPSTVC